MPLLTDLATLAGDEPSFVLLTAHTPGLTPDERQFMADHGKNADGDYSYHHCAVVNITADTTKPVDNRWSAPRK